MSGVSTRFVFSSDWHLKPKIRTNINLLHDTYVGAAQVVNHCYKYKLPLVLGGDQYDSPRPDSLSVYVMTILVNSLTSKGIPVYMLDGNHDKSKPSWSRVLPGVVDLAEAGTCDIRGLKVKGIPWGHKDAVEAELGFTGDTGTPGTGGNLDNPDILVMHQLLNTICTLDGMWNLDYRWVPPSTRLVLMGDYHKPSDWESESGTYFMYPGSLAHMSTNEFHETGFLEIGTNSSTQDPDSISLSVKRVPTFSRAQVTYRNNQRCLLGSLEELELLVDYLEVLYSPGDIIPGEKFEYHKDFKLDCKEIMPYISLDNIRQPYVHVRFDPARLSLEDIHRRLDSERYHVVASPVAGNSTDNLGNNPDNLGNNPQDRRDYNTVLRDSIDHLVKSQDLPEESGQLVHDLVTTGGQKEAMEEWRRKYGLD